MNTFKTMILMAALTGLLVACGGAFGGQHGAAIMLIISLGFNFFSYWFSDTMVLKAYGAREVSQHEAPELYALVSNLAHKADLPMPKVCIVESASPNAFATGRNPSHAAVAVTTGIMQALSMEELGGVEPVADILVKSAKLHGTTFGADIMPRLIDEIPAIAVAAMYAEGDTIITGAGELRVKETDRLQAITDQYNKLKNCIEATDDGLVIHGS